MKLDGCLYDSPPRDITPFTTWGGPLEEHRSETQDKNEYLQDLEKLDEGNVEVCNGCMIIVCPFVYYVSILNTHSSIYQEQEINSKNYKLESIVKVWSDFLRPHLHPQSLLTIPGYHHNE